jgi:hypothetical protein
VKELKGVLKGVSGSELAKRKILKVGSMEEFASGVHCSARPRLMRGTKVVVTIRLVKFMSAGRCPLNQFLLIDVSEGSRDLRLDKQQATASEFARGCTDVEQVSLAQGAFLVRASSLKRT